MVGVRAERHPQHSHARSAQRSTAPLAGVFMNVPVAADGTLRLLPAPTAAGDSITFEAALDCVVALSACPQDLTGINGAEPTELALDLLGADRP